MLQSFVFNLFLISELNLVCNYVFVGLVHRRARLPRSLEEVWQTPFLRLVQFIENVWKGASCPLITFFLCRDQDLNSTIEYIERIYKTRISPRILLLLFSC